MNLSDYLDGLYSYALILTRNRTEAEDLVQETCRRALRALAGLRGQGSAKSWLFCILRNTWLHQLRRSQTATPVIALGADEEDTNLVADTAEHPHSDDTNDIEPGPLRDAIQQLPIESREIILLREYEDLSYLEIGDLLRCPVTTVMSRLTRARIKLRNLLLCHTEEASRSSSE